MNIESSGDSDLIVGEEDKPSLLN